MLIAVQVFRSSDTSVLQFSVGLAGRRYNSVSTTMLRYDSAETWEPRIK